MHAWPVWHLWVTQQQTAASLGWVLYSHHVVHPPHPLIHPKAQQASTFGSLCIPQAPCPPPRSTTAPCSPTTSDYLSSTLEPTERAPPNQPTKSVLTSSNRPLQPQMRASCPSRTFTSTCLHPSCTFGVGAAVQSCHGAIMGQSWKKR
jgi:hypothetical protein